MDNNTVFRFAFLFLYLNMEAVTKVGMYVGYEFSGLCM